MDLHRKWIKLKRDIKKASSDLEENIKNIKEIIDREKIQCEHKGKKEEYEK